MSTPIEFFQVHESVMTGIWACKLRVDRVLNQMGLTHEFVIQGNPTRPRSLVWLLPPVRIELEHYPIVRVRVRVRIQGPLQEAREWAERYKRDHPHEVLQRLGPDINKVGDPDRVYFIQRTCMPETLANMLAGELWPYLATGREGSDWHPLI